MNGGCTAVSPGAWITVGIHFPAHVVAGASTRATWRPSSVCVRRCRTSSGRRHTLPTHDTRRLHADGAPKPPSAGSCERSIALAMDAHLQRRAQGRVSPGLPSRAADARTRTVCVLTRHQTQQDVPGPSAFEVNDRAHQPAAVDTAGARDARLSMQESIGDHSPRSAAGLASLTWCGTP